VIIDSGASGDTTAETITKGTEAARRRPMSVVSRIVDTRSERAIGIGYRCRRSSLRGPSTNESALWARCDGRTVTNITSS